MPAGHFEGLIGNATIAHLLTSSLEKPAPAYLFLGPPHLGKRAFAERFVRQLLNVDMTSNWRAHPDAVVLEPEEGKKQVSVEQVRRLRERVSFRPMVAPRVVAYLPTADAFNESGMNALLKMLEEPPADAVFVLVAEDAGRIPATVMSRVVTMPFRSVPKQEIIDALVARRISPTEAERRAVASHGRPGLAIETSQEENQNVAFAEQFVTAQTLGRRLSLISEISATCDSAEDSASAWRDALLSLMQSSGVLLQKYPVEASIFGHSLVTALRFVGGPISPRVALEAGAVRASTVPEKELQKLFPTHLPRSVPVIFESLVQ